MGAFYIFRTEERPLNPGYDSREGQGERIEQEEQEQGLGFRVEREERRGVKIKIEMVHGASDVLRSCMQRSCFCFVRLLRLFCFWHCTLTTVCRVPHVTAPIAVAPDSDRFTSQQPAKEEKRNSGRVAAVLKT